MPRTTLLFILTGLMGLVFAMVAPLLGSAPVAGTISPLLIPLGYLLMLSGAIAASVDFVVRRALAASAG